VAGELVTGSWRRLVFAHPDLPETGVDRAAYVMCVLEQLRRALRRRDVYAAGADRWGDPRARLVSGPAWDAARGTVLTALGLDDEPAGHLAELTCALHAAYVQTVDGLPGNTMARIQDGRLALDRLGPAPEPALMPVLRAQVAAMLPRVDFPDLLLEIAARTGLASAFTHISGAQTSTEDFAISLCAVILAEACNVGLVPVTNPAVPALTA